MERSGLQIQAWRSLISALVIESLGLDESIYLREGECQVRRDEDKVLSNSNIRRSNDIV